MPADPSRLEIAAVANGAAMMLFLSGELDSDSFSLFVEAGERLIADGHRDLVIDCADLTFCDSFGLKAFTTLWMQVQPDGSVTINQPSTMLTRILDISGLADQFRSPMPPAPPTTR